jgi:hypothetical protein
MASDSSQTTPSRNQPSPPAMRHAMPCQPSAQPGPESSSVFTLLVPRTPRMPSCSRSQPLAALQRRSGILEPKPGLSVTSSPAATQC